MFVVRRAPLLPERPLVAATNADKTCLDGQGGHLCTHLSALSDTWRHRRNGTETMQQQKPHYADRYGGGCAVTPKIWFDWFAFAWETFRARGL